MKKKEITVVIIGRDNSNTLGLVRQYGPYVDNLHVVLWDRFIKPLSSVVASKYCKNYHWESTLEAALDYIVTMFKGKYPNIFIVPSGDLPAEIIDQRQCDLSPFFYIPGTHEKGLLSKVLDKNMMCKIAKQIGFNVPHSMEVKGKTTKVGDVEYPCLVKPVKHGLYTKTNFKTKICNNEDELISFLSLLDESSIYQVQEYVKKNSEVLTYGYRLKNGTTKTFGVLYRLRGGENTDTTFGYIEPEVPLFIDQKLEERFLKEIDFSGLFSFEYGVHNEKPYFFEVNLRNDATAYWFYLAGADVPAMWVYESLGLATDVLPHEISEKHYFIDEITDKLYVKNGMISKDEYKKSLIQSSLLKYKSKEDPAPYYIRILSERISECYHTARNVQKHINGFFRKIVHSKQSGGGQK